MPGTPLNNAVEMQLEFEKLLQVVNPAFENMEKLDSDTIFRFLNLAINKYIKDKYLNNPDIITNILALRQKSADLRKLIDHTEITTLTTGDINTSYKAALPSDFLAYIRSDSQVTRSYTPLVSSPSWVSNIEAVHEEVGKITTTPFNKPILREPVILFEGDYMVVFIDEYTKLYKVNLTYVRQPLTLALTNVASVSSTECELPPHTHTRIVEEAVNIYLADYKFKLSQKQESK